MVRKIHSKRPPRVREKNNPAGLNFEVMILAGGAGSRLKSVLPDRPKILAEVGGRPFLDILVEQLCEQDASRIILCLGHLKEQVINYVGKKILTDQRFGRLEFALEENPLGTGGAIKNALNRVRSKHFFLMNGDSLWKGVSLRDLYDFHIEKQSTVSIALCPKMDAHVYGRVLLNDDNRIIQFAEKKKLPGKGLVNAGIYLIRKEAFSDVHDGEKFSVEYDVLPKFVKEGVCYGLTIKGDFLDIGTPERYRSAENFLKSMRNKPRQ